MPALNLIVIRSRDIDRMAEFYNVLGLNFGKHTHGQSPEHYASENNGVVIELYPATEKEPPTTDIRLGFQVDVPLEEPLFSALEKKGGRVASCWSALAIVLDPDGHKVHLLKR